jgi:hypothetical protein
MRRTLLALFASLSAACGNADPCSAPTAGVSLHGASLQQLAIGASSLDCVGSVAGSELTCSGSPSVEAVACDDGFGITLSQGDTTLLVHLANIEGWSAGAMLADGTAAVGDLTIAGLSASPQPPVNTTVAGSFDLRADQAKVNGGFRFVWSAKQTTPAMPSP